MRCRADAWARKYWRAKPAAVLDASRRMPPAKIKISSSPGAAAAIGHGPAIEAAELGRYAQNRNAALFIDTAKHGANRRMKYPSGDESAMRQPYDATAQLY